MVGSGCGCIIFLVTIDTIVSDPVKPQCGFGFMTVRAGREGMRSEKRKAVVVMQFGDVVYQPIFGIMTP